MGKAVPRLVKNRAEELLTEFPDQFSTDFEKNKGAVNAVELPLSKSTRNKVAGFITRTKNKKK